MTLLSSSSNSWATRQSNDGVIRVTTNESNIVVGRPASNMLEIVGGLDLKVEYEVTLAVQTAARKAVTGKS